MPSTTSARTAATGRSARRTATTSGAPTRRRIVRSTPSSAGGERNTGGRSRCRCATAMTVRTASENCSAVVEAPDATRLAALRRGRAAGPATGPRPARWEPGAAATGPEATAAERDGPATEPGVPSRSDGVGSGAGTTLSGRMVEGMSTVSRTGVTARAGRRMNDVRTRSSAVAHSGSGPQTVLGALVVRDRTRRRGVLRVRDPGPLVPTHRRRQPRARRPPRRSGRRHDLVVPLSHRARRPVAL